MKADNRLSHNSGTDKKKYKIITSVLIVLAIVSFGLTVGSMVYFRTQVKRDIDLADEQYKNYERHYVLVARDNNDSFWTSAYENMRLEGEKSSIYVEKMGNNLAVDYSNMQLMEIAIDSQVDGIIFEADDSTESITLINRAIKEGIPVVTVRNDAALSARRSFVGVSYYNLGTEYGKLILKASRNIVKQKKDADEGSVVNVLVLVDANVADTSQNVTVNAIKERLEKSKNEEIVYEVSTVEIDNSGEFTEEESIRDMLKNSELPDVIVCLNEVNTVSVYQTLVERNKVGEAVVLGYYNSEPILKAIDKKVVYATITIDSAQLGKDCVDALTEYTDYGRVSEYYGVNYVVIDADNIDDYIGKEVNNE